MRIVLNPFSEKETRHLLQTVKARNLPNRAINIVGDCFRIGEWQQR